MINIIFVLVIVAALLGGYAAESKEKNPDKGSSITFSIEKDKE